MFQNFKNNTIFFLQNFINFIYKNFYKSGGKNLLFFRNSGAFEVQLNKIYFILYVRTLERLNILEWKLIFIAVIKNN